MSGMSDPTNTGSVEARGVVKDINSGNEEAYNKHVRAASEAQASIRFLEEQLYACGRDRAHSESVAAMRDAATAGRLATAHTELSSLGSK